MALHADAGKKAPIELLADIPSLISSYYTLQPDAANVAEQVAFGTSGHRGSSAKKSFNEAHILAISQAICEFRKKEGITGPLFLGMDTHALSESARRSAIEVFSANGVEVRYQKGFGYTPTPVISHAILTHNRENSAKADGVVITPSHNPPEDGGFKYNPPSGGPAGPESTDGIQQRANTIIKENCKEVVRTPYAEALQAENVQDIDFVMPYVLDLKNVIDMEAIRSSGIKIGVDPMGGSGVAYWEPIAEVYGLDIEIVNRDTDPRFGFMSVDKDGKIRMDCSSKYAMASLISLKERFDIAFGNDPDYDRHGIVTKEGLMNPNHYLAVAINYLFSHRKEWGRNVGIGKTLVSSSMIDRVARSLERELVEVPVGFKWFVDGLIEGRLGFGGEESAGASFLRRDGTVWSSDKDGIIMDLLSAEITAVTGKNPSEHYRALEQKHGSPLYERSDAPATREEKKRLKSLSEKDISADMLAGEKITAIATKANGNNAAIGGIKVSTENGWFAARPSGTEDIYKIYAESFLGGYHLNELQKEAEEIVKKAIS